MSCPFVGDCLPTNAFPNIHVFFVITSWLNPTQLTVHLSYYLKEKLQPSDFTYPLYLYFFTAFVFNLFPPEVWWFRFYGALPWLALTSCNCRTSYIGSKWVVFCHHLPAGGRLRSQVAHDSPFCSYAQLKCC